MFLRTFLAGFDLQCNSISKEMYDRMHNKYPPAEQGVNSGEIAVDLSGHNFHNIPSLFTILPRENCKQENQSPAWYVALGRWLPF